MAQNDYETMDVVLVGAGIMSATLAVLLKELDPGIKLEVLEMMDAGALESSNPWNNAGTGHAGLCELNYTPEAEDGSIDIKKSVTINTQFEESKQFWAYLVEKGRFGTPQSFINPIPHLSFVRGQKGIDFLKKRFKALTVHHAFADMEYTEDRATLQEWMPLLQMSGIEEGKGFGGFPVSGMWLRCDNQDVVRQHQSKVYSQAAVGSPPMSVPHLDTRMVDGKTSLLFGPYAGFTTKFLKRGSFLDLPLSIRFNNIGPMLAVARDNFDLTRYLVKEVLQSEAQRLETLRGFYPLAKAEDWSLEVAGQRVQIIKKDAKNGGILQFGTELVAAKDGTIAALLGASPGASVTASIMLDLIQRCFPEQVASAQWQTKLAEIFPAMGKVLANDAERYREVQARSDALLQLEPLEQPVNA